MAIGSWQVSEAFDTSNSHIKYRIACLENSTSISNNSSNVRVTINIWRTNQGYTTHGTGTAYVTINGTQYTQAITSSQAITYNDYNSNYFDKTLDIPHGTDGKKTLTISAYISHERFSSSSHSANFGMTDIPRQTSITKFTVDKYSNTKLKVNWQTADSVKKVEYSTDNGSTFKQGWANDNGATSGNFVISQLSANNNALSPNTPYNCVIRVTRKDSGLTTPSSAVPQTTYKTPTTAISSKTETSITMSWSIDSAASYIQYSIDNGSWVNVGNTTATSGTYTINNLSANSQHSIKTHIIRAASKEYETTNTASDTTYNYPYCTEAPNFTIGNSVTIKFYNPLNRSLQIQMYSHVLGDFVTDLITIGKVTQYTFTPDASRLYSSIPNNQSSKYNIDVWYNNNKSIGDKGTSYSINTSSVKPGFSNFAYKDVGTSALTAAIANNQVIVQGVSNINLVISSDNKMTPSTNASACTSSNSKYVVTFDNLSKTQAYSDNDIDVNMGVPTGNGNKIFTVTAYDSRNIPNSVPKTIDIKPYSQPEVSPSLERLNGFETATTFSVAGTFAPVTVSDTDKNQISSVKYRYKESSSSTWGDWTAMTIESQGSGSYQTTSVTLQCDNEKQFDFQFEVTDLARTVTVSRTLSVGVPLMFLHTNGILDVQNGINSGKTDGSGSFKLNGNWDSQIYWKEYGYGDKFRIYPEFGGTDNDNKLRIQGAVGDAGTDPSLYDLMTISGKNGNLWLKGGAEVNGAISRNLGGSGTTISDTNIIDISGSTDGFQLKYKSTTADNGVTTMQTTDDSNAILSIGNEYSGAYHEALKILEGQVKMVKGSSWVQDRVNSIIRMTYVGNNGAYGPCICIGTKNGTWTLGCLSGEDNLTFNYVTDTNFSNNNNTSNRYTLGTSGYFSGTCNGCNWSNYPSGFSSKSSGQSWGVQTGTFITGWGDSTGGSIAFRRDCPTGGQMSMIIDGSIYVQEGQCRCFGVKSLYDNASGSTGTITLSESASNFSYLEIFYKEQAGKGGQNQDHNSVKVYSPNGAKFVLQLVEKSGSTDMRFCTSRGSISGTSITRGNGAAFYLNGGRWEVEEINIYKVIGYK